MFSFYTSSFSRIKYVYVGVFLYIFILNPVKIIPVELYWSDVIFCILKWIEAIWPWKCIW